MLVVAIIAAILLGASIPSLISALIASIAVALKYIIAAAAIGVASMTAAMADVFGFNENSLEKDAKKEEQNKDKGIFGRWYDKFKNWLD